ncbi:MAG: hypothetical protein LBP35_03600 [Candidatus Ancillula trichonymphae]|nr:hypothetical protein [Candidatus Ancillula trichonymphae]
MNKRKDLIKYVQNNDFWSRLIESVNRRVKLKSKFILFLEGRALKGVHLDDLLADEQEFLGYLPSARAEARVRKLREAEEQALFDVDEAEDAQIVEDVPATEDAQSGSELLPPKPTEAELVAAHEFTHE